MALALAATVTAGVSAAPLSGLTPELPLGGTFLDDDRTTHEGEIEAIYAAEITRGCVVEGNRFCPTESTTRGQAAALLARALGLEPSTTDWFADDDASSFEAEINAVAAAGITVGCDVLDPGRYCPFDPLTRAQFASMLVRALALSPSDADYFTDDAGSVHEANINALADAEVTIGCDTERVRFCPSEPVVRAQAAAMLSRGLDLTPIIPEPIASGPMTFQRGFSYNGDDTVFVTTTRSDFAPLVQGSNPVLSPDRTHVAFVRATPIPGVDPADEFPNYWDLMVIGIDGASELRLTQELLATYPSWSPDGSRIAFMSFPEDSTPLMIINTDGTGLSAIGSAGSRPSWSPDGTHLVTSRGPTNLSMIEVRTAEGILTAPLIVGLGPQWSPDGTAILFWRYADDLLYVMSPDGTDQRAIAESDTSGEWSPDGTKIAFIRRGVDYLDEAQGLYVMNADGTNVVKVASDTTQTGDPFIGGFITGRIAEVEWSPDSRQIAYEVGHDIWVVRADGTGHALLIEDAHSLDW